MGFVILEEMIPEETEAGTEIEIGIVTGDETGPDHETGKGEAGVATGDATEVETGEGVEAETEKGARDHAAVVATERGDAKREKSVRPEEKVTASASRKNRRILVIMISMTTRV